MIEILPVIAALSTVIAVIAFLVAMGVPLISGYGVGQYGDNNMDDLITESKEKAPMPQKEVIIVSGYLSHEHWAQKPWIRWLEKIHREKNITTKVITGPHNDKESMDAIKKLIEEEAIKLKALEEAETMHFFIIDEDWAHIEEEHIAPGIPKGIIVKHLFPGPRKALHGKFETLWNKAKPVAAENIENIFAS